MSVNREIQVGAVDPVVGPVDGDERLAEIAQGGFARWPDVLSRSP